MCLFYNWVYKDKELVSTSDDICETVIYTKRFCRKCGKLQEDYGKFKGVQECYSYKHKWRTIGYLKKGSHDSEEKK